MLKDLFSANVALSASQERINEKEGLIMEKYSSLDLLFEIELRHLYNIEQQSGADLCQIFKVAASEKLKQLLDRNILESRLQIQRLDRAFEILNIDIHHSTMDGLHGFRNILREGYVNLIHKDSIDMSKGIMGILSEGHDILHHFVHTTASDIALICSELKVAKFEIASYRFLCNMAEQYAKFAPVSGLLQVSLKEKEQTYQRLSELSTEEIHNLELKDKKNLDAKNCRKLPYTYTRTRNSLNRGI